MRVDVYHHIELGCEVSAKLDAVLRKLDLIIHNEATIMSELTDALDAVEASAKANSDADDAAEKLLLALSKMISDLKANATDPATIARIKALSDALTARAGQLATAVVAGTPAA